MKFEDSMKRLDEILESLKSEEISLNDSVKLYKEGVELHEKMVKEINSLKNEVEVINREMGDMVKEDLLDIYG
ncbi:MAG: exodeoxyribonuclease VII small subunit [Tissierellia bacterium]|nr:exodeoxyribonuclease VII small subunit [Tissierellia bacterium]